MKFVAAVHLENSFNRKTAKPTSGIALE